ncbi:MAG: valine--tRNA ligase [Candidatus Marinimicrobia bacterium]|nr:valine--tRNA ligase [Candidatus Neomarinimicrobiota bacterium]
MTELHLPKVYDPKTVEKKWYAHWLKRNYFHASVNPDKQPFTIIIPPPNVTGSLTIGHVLNNTIQDILIRRARMRGMEACWIPGTDHASIATEVKVETMLREMGTSKHEIGREEFLKHAWKWKEKYGALIIEQLKRLGCSCDWEREKFTMDEGYYRAVISAFVRLYKKGLIYRGVRLVNWDPKTQSAISDEEVVYKEVKGHLWYFRYPIKGTDGYVVVATTRPETMLGDTGVAVNPKDDRYRHLIGRTVILPLVGRELPIIADEYVDPEFGTGCLKVTPAHDPNDFEMGKKHDLEMVNILNEDASLNNNVPEEFRGLDRFEAREKVVQRLQDLGLMEKIEEYTTKIGYSQRGGVPIEPYLSEQWFMKMNDLARPALEVVKNGGIKFYPEHWVKTYEHWMGNIRDWCISRQLWWGHRIPVWTHKDNGEIYCEVEPPEDSGNWTQDPDVLDTWASSWLWPIGVHHWPEESEDLRYFHPTNDLVTGPDIIFFWVARMIMSSLEFMGEIPFQNVYFTGMVRDLQGRKMSKSLGNSPDPLSIIDKYGADALRFGIMLIAPQGQDILFSEDRIVVGRNFMNKLWNASRFLLLNGDTVIPKPLSKLDQEKFELADLWILSRLNRMIMQVDKLFEAYRFNGIAKKIYDFTWSDFCDWYVEVIKSRLYGDDDSSKQIAFSIAIHVVRNILKVLHPFAPFITEEIWQKFKGIQMDHEEQTDLVVSNWPNVNDVMINSDVESEFRELQVVITGIRTIRSVMNVPPGRRSDLLIRGDDGEFVRTHMKIIHDLAKVNNLSIGSDLGKPPHAATVVVGDMELFIPLEGLIDVNKERERLAKEIEQMEIRRQRAAEKLNNENFVSRAPGQVVEKERKRLLDMSENLIKLKQNFDVLIQ